MIDFVKLFAKLFVKSRQFPNLRLRRKFVLLWFGLVVLAVMALLAAMIATATLAENGLQELAAGSAVKSTVKQ